MSFNPIHRIFVFIKDRRRLHLLFCRNVTCYFNRDEQLKLIGKYDRYLSPGFSLFPDALESLKEVFSKFRIMPASICRKDWKA